MLLNQKKNQRSWSILLACAAVLFSQEILAAQPMMITVTKGFGLTLYASELGDAKQLALGDKGTLFVGSHKKGTIVALVDSNADGRVDKRYVVAKGLDNPEAIAFHDGDLYVAVDEKIIRFVDIENRLRRPGRGKEIYDRLPGQTNKSQRAMHFGPDGRLYVAIGAPCNVCEAVAPFGSIIAIDIATGSSEQVATGIRTVTGFDWSPLDDALWFADQGRDWMGDRLPPDEINRLETTGEHFGFPYIHAASVIEPAYDRPKNLKITLPNFELPAHVAPTGLHFYRGQAFPAKYHNQIFVAENGSWNRSSKIGYQVVMLEIEQQKVVKRSTVVSFLDGGFPVARPYALLTAPDGAMYISDDLKGNIYRLYYKDIVKKKLEQAAQAEETEK
ncbi:PQQ-dependent sugar dehydrogenase [Shewanella sp.]|uniref:PQQ-dependent sugar dehydrogenase n=1 Tax=Shewanella sp. TaxID=50422 RepID=UPI001EC1E5E2|nr:PQQ-dependent sugar dehydrogenase [Shewanella sp.]NRB24916.1 PQQ-dependent sugar dehydrogenase [Shewanella sp.]